MFQELKKSCCPGKTALPRYSQLLEIAKVSTWSSLPDAKKINPSVSISPPNPLNLTKTTKISPTLSYLDQSMAV